MSDARHVSDAHHVSDARGVSDDVASSIMCTITLILARSLALTVVSDIILASKFPRGKHKSFKASLTRGIYQHTALSQHLPLSLSPSALFFYLSPSLLSGAPDSATARLHDA